MDRPVGELSVGANGFCTYQYHIAVPPGIGHGNEPGLSLNFSQGMTTNGILGAKWALAGISTISRICPTVAVDKYAFPANGPSYSSRFALDGMELLCIAGNYGEAGSQYKLELDSGTGRTVTFSGTTFQVVDQFGETQVYGVTPDSLTTVVLDNQTVPVEWKISASYDFRGNYVKFNYTQSPTIMTPPSPAPPASLPDFGINYIDSIQYTLNDALGSIGALQVKFLYSSRLDPVVASTWGRTTCTAHLLTEISTFANNQPARSYKIQYNQSPATGDSLITSIVELGSLGAMLTPTTFQYSGTSPSSWTSILKQGEAVTLPPTANSSTLFPVNLTGRSYADLVSVQTEPGGGGGSATQISMTSFVASPIPGGQGLDPSVTWSPEPASSNTTDIAEAEVDSATGTRQFSLLAADVNRDGRTDIVVPYEDVDGTLAFSVAQASGLKFAESVIVRSAQDWQSNSTFFALDMDGDGAIDVVQIHSTPDKLTHQIWVYYDLYSAMQSVQPPDVVTTDEWSDEVQTINWFPVQLPISNSAGLVQITQDDQVDATIVSARLFAPTGNPFSRSTLSGGSSVELFSYAPTGKPDVQSVLAVDINGDGIQDIVACNCRNEVVGGIPSLIFDFQTCLFDGVSNFSASAASVSYNIALGDQVGIPSPGSFYVINLDGSRYPCIMYVFEEENGNLNAVFGMGSSTGTIGDLELVSLADKPDTGRWKLTPTDVNAVGRGGFVLSLFDQNEDSYTVCPVYNINETSDRLEAVTNPMGLRQEIVYRSMSDPSVYQPGLQWNDYPAPDGQGLVVSMGSSTCLVSQLNIKSDPLVNALPIGGQGQGAQRTRRFTYEWGRMDRQGRGWLGFGNITQTDVENNIQTISSYDWNWPLNGTLQQQTVMGCDRTGLLSRLSSWPPVGAQTDDLQNLKTLNFYYQDVTLSNTRQAPIHLIAIKKRETYMYEDTNIGNGTPQFFATEYEYQANTKQKTLEHFYQVNLQDTKTNLTETWTKTAYTTISVDSAIVASVLVPSAQKVTGSQQSSIDNDFDHFEPGDYSLTQYVWTQNASVLDVSRWSDDLNQWSVKHHEFDQAGNEVVLSYKDPTTSTLMMQTTTTYDPLYHAYPIVTSQVGQSIASASSYRAFDPRYGTEVASQSLFGDVVAKELDQWGRTLEQWQLIGKENTSPSSVELPPPTVVSKPLLQNLSTPQFVVSASISYNSPTNPSGPNYMVKSILTLNDASSTSQSPKLEFFDAEGHLRKTRTQDNGLTPVTWQYQEFNSQASLTLQSYQTKLVDGPSWIPDYRSCQITLYDGLNRPIINVKPPSLPGGLFTSLETIYAEGGALHVTNLRQSQNVQFTSTDVIAESLQYGFLFFAAEPRLISQANADGAIQKYDYDEIGQLTTITDPAGIQEKRLYNSFGQVKMINNPCQNPLNTSFGIQKIHDIYGRISTETNAEQESVTYHHDGKGRLSSRKDWMGTTTVYTWDADLAVDKLARVAINGSDGMLQSSYDYTYDTRGLLESETLTLTTGAPGSYTTRFTYDRQGNLIQKVLPDSSSNIFVWKGPHLCEVQLSSPTVDSRENWALIATAVAYDANGNPTDWKLSGQQDAANANGFGFHTDWDLENRPLHMTFGKHSTTTLDFEYNALDQISSLTKNGIVKQYGYTNRRLTSVTSPGSGPQSFRYDLSGNMTQNADAMFTFQKTASGATVQGSSTNGTKYAYNWDGAGRMVARNWGDMQSTITYDGYGKMNSYTIVDLAGQQTTTSIYSDHKAQTILKINGLGPVTVHLGSDLDLVMEGGNRLYQRRLVAFGKTIASMASTYYSDGSIEGQLSVYATDHKGTVLQAFDGSGAVSEDRVYSPYGLLLTGGDPQAAFEGKRQDPWSSLIDFGGRWYDPVLGQFTTPDWNFDTKHMLKQDSINLFVFESNDPINSIDPSGHWNWQAFGGAMVGLAILAVGIAILTGGIAVPFLGAIAIEALAGGLTGAGAAALSYSVAHRETTDRNQFWKGFAIETIIGGVTGAISGAGGEFLGSSARITNFMEVNGRAAGLESEAVLDAASGAFNERYILKLGGTSMMNFSLSIAGKGAKVGLDNRFLGTHETLTWQEVAETAVSTAIFAGLVPMAKFKGQSTSQYSRLRLLGKARWSRFKDGNKVPDYFGDAELEDTNIGDFRVDYGYNTFDRGIEMRSMNSNGPM